MWHNEPVGIPKGAALPPDSDLMQMFPLPLTTGKARPFAKMHKKSDDEDDTGYG